MIKFVGVYFGVFNVLEVVVVCILDVFAGSGLEVSDLNFVKEYICHLLHLPDVYLVLHLILQFFLIL